MDITNLLVVYAILAVLLFVVGTMYNILKTTWHRAKMKREMYHRNVSFYPVKKMPFLQALWRMNVTPFTRFWMRANPITFAGHVLYHFGLFTAIGIYVIVAVLVLDEITTMQAAEVLPLLFDWFHYTDQVFGTSGLLGAIGEIMILIFVFALICGTVGMAIPFIMSALGKRGMIIPIDDVTRNAKIYTQGLPRSSMLGYQRKFVGLIVLVVDIAMLSTFFTPIFAEYAYVIHVTFALTIIAIFPFSFLFHELARWRMFTGVRRMMDRRTA